MSFLAYCLIGVLCTVGDGELILDSDPTRKSRHDFPPVGQEGHCFFSYWDGKVMQALTNKCEIEDILPILVSGML